MIGLDDQVYVQKFDAGGSSAGGYALTRPGQAKAFSLGFDGNNDPELFVIGPDDQVYGLQCDAGGRPAGNYFLTRPGQVKALRAGG